MLGIRLASLDDLASLAAVERRAASVFRDAGLAWIAEADTMSLTGLATMCQNRTLWVGVNTADRPVGFLAGRPLDRQFHIAELSVLPGYQRQGLGTALIAAATDHARDSRCRYITLTTYRDLAWNGPFYARLGFVEIEPASLGPDHVRQSLAEADAGHDPLRRCVMVKTIRPEPVQNLV